MQEIEFLESDLDINFDSLEEKKVALENLRKEYLQGHMIRSRARWIEEGEKPSKYFCNLESRNFLNKTIKKIYIEGIGMVYEQAEILDNIRSYYDKLYASTESNLIDIELQSLFNNYNIPKLDRILQLVSNMTF